MRNSSLQFYGLFVIFVGILATAAACLGVAFGLGLLNANGHLSLRNALFLRDALFFLLLGIGALRSGGRIRHYSRAALVGWEWVCWTIAILVLITTLAAIALVNVGVEYLVFTLFYLLLATSASSVRRRNQGFFDYRNRTTLVGNQPGSIRP
ncbi:MAG: hypothetical protein R3F41_06370 [Gammaproteobacteria bacterium]|nr:hypothetical protein [Pseudomonadales bacterium]MCP5348540.1 hypothetical protein [Pseudomonadales bacterium]